MDRPRLLLVPEFTELEWTIRPHLEQWAVVVAYDPPGVGDEPAAETFDRDAIVRRGLEELERRGWERCFIASDSWRRAARSTRSRPSERDFCESVQRRGGG